MSQARTRRDLSQTSIGPQRQHEQNLNLLRQLRGRWTTMLESEESARLKQEAATYLSRLAPHEHIQGRELRLLQQMTSGSARPTLSDEGVPVEADPKKALKDLDKKIRSLSARNTEGGQGESSARVVRAEVQVFGAQQPMKTGTFQGVQTELRAQRDSEAQAETLAQRPEPKTHTIGSSVQGHLTEVVQNRTTLPFTAKESPRRSHETLVEQRKPLLPKAEPRAPHPQVRILDEPVRPQQPGTVKPEGQPRLENRKLDPRPKPQPEARKPDPQLVQPKPQPEVRKPEPQAIQPKPQTEVRKPDPQTVQPKPQPQVRVPDPQGIPPKPQPEVRKPDPRTIQPKPQPQVRVPDPQSIQVKPQPEVRKPDPQTIQPKPQPEVRKPDPQSIQVKPQPEVLKPDPQTIQLKPQPGVRKPDPQSIQPKPQPEVRKPDPQTIQPKPQPEVRKPDPQSIQVKPQPQVRKPDPQTIPPKPQPEVRKPEPQTIQPKPQPPVRIPDPQPIQPKSQPEVRKPDPQPTQPKPPEVREPNPQSSQPKPQPEVHKPDPQPIQPKPQPGVRTPDPQPIQPTPQPEVRKPDPQPIQPKPQPEVRKPDPQSIQPKPQLEVRKPDPQPIQPEPQPEVRKLDPQPIQPRPQPEVRKPDPQILQPEVRKLEPQPGLNLQSQVQKADRAVDPAPARPKVLPDEPQREVEKAPELPRPLLQSPGEAVKAQKAKEAKAAEALKKELPRPAAAEELPRLKEEPPAPPLSENKPINALKTLAPLASVKTTTLEKGGEARTKYPEWLQVKLSQDATPAYMTSLPGQQRAPKPVETQPLTVPQQAVDALTKTDFRRTDELREITSQQQKTIQAITQPAPPATAAKATQLFQAVVGQGLMASQRPPQDAPKTQEPQRRSLQDEEKEKEKGISAVSAGTNTSVPGAGRLSGKSEIIEARAMGAVLSGSVGKRDGAEAAPPPPPRAPEAPPADARPPAPEGANSKNPKGAGQEKVAMPNLASGWADQPAPDNGATLSNGRVVSAESPVHSPALDELANRLKQGKPLPPLAQKEPERPLFFDQSEDHHSPYREDDARLERLEKSGALVQAFHQAEASHNTKKREETQQQPAGGKVEDVGDQSNRRGGGGSGSGQQRERDQQGGQGAQHVQDQQQLQSQRRTQSDTKIELQRLEAYRLAKTDEALKIGLRMSHQPEGKQLAELMNRHAGHSMESLLKKAYRLDSLGELSREDAVNALGLVLKLGGEFTFAHSARVLELAMDLADEVGVSDKKTRSQVQLGALLKDTGEMALMLDQAPPGKLEKMSDWLGSQDLRQAGLLHDIGKTRIPPEILYKPGKLTEEEYELMKLHPIIGEQMIYPIESLRHLCPTIRGHHEKWDGSGYPDGLKGEDIPYAARIIAIADVFDALHAERPYKAGMPVERVQAILREGRGTHFDPDLLDAFERVIQRRHPELSNPFA